RVDRAADAGFAQRRQRVLGEARHDPGTQVGGRAHIEDEMAVGDLLQYPRIFYGPDTVTDTGRFERQHLRDRGGTRALSGVRYERQATVAGDVKGATVRGSRRRRLEAAEPQPDHAAVGVAYGGPRALLGEDRIGGAVQVRGEQDRDAVALGGFDRALGVSGEDLIPGEAPFDTLGRREDRLEVDRAE